MKTSRKPGKPGKKLEFLSFWPEELRNDDEYLRAYNALERGKTIFNSTELCTVGENIRPIASPIPTAEPTAEPTEVVMTDERNMTMTLDESNKKLVPSNRQLIFCDEQTGYGVRVTNLNTTGGLVVGCEEVIRVAVNSIIKVNKGELEPKEPKVEFGYTIMTRSLSPLFKQFMITLTLGGEDCMALDWEGITEEGAEGTEGGEGEGEDEEGEGEGEDEEE
ncbi:hypothetical protein ABW19_dt0210053 [Dactylella cylindrospora]|nr:hypothetical protein ABW19_dt0210053 [Dactylella cylindrospora]